MPQIITYIDNYKDQTIKFILSILEDEFGYTGMERPDLYDIKSVYQQKPQSNFWLAISENEVVGTIAIKNMSDNSVVRNCTPNFRHNSMIIKNIS